MSSGFCSFDQWYEKLAQNFFNLLNKLYLDLDNYVFYFEYYYIFKLRKVKLHLSLFSICIHCMRCTRSCDKLPKSKYCFYCSRVRMSNFDMPSNFYDIDMDPHDYSENFRNLMRYSTVDLDIQADPMPFLIIRLREVVHYVNNLKFIQGLDIYVFLFRVFWFACILILLWRPYLILM